MWLDGDHQNTVRGSQYLAQSLVRVALFSRAPGRVGSALAFPVWSARHREARAECELSPGSNESRAFEPTIAPSHTSTTILLCMMWFLCRLPPVQRNCDPEHNTAWLLEVLQSSSSHLRACRACGSAACHDATQKPMPRNPNGKTPPRDWHSHCPERPASGASQKAGGQ